MIKRSSNFISNQRIDLSNLRSIESAGRSDFDDLFSGSMTGGNSYVIKGFTISATFGNQASSAQLLVADSALLHSQSQTSGTILVLPSSEAPQPLNTVTNSKVVGSFTANADNYVSIEYIRAVDPSTTDTVYLWDPSTQAEISKSIPLALILDYRIVISNSPPSSNGLPIARIRTNAQNGVSQLEDRRPLFLRLGRGGNNPPNPAYVYPWSQGRDENPSTKTDGSGADPFLGGDKQLLSLKDWMDATMSLIKEIKGTTYWYSPISASGSITSLAEDTTKAIVTGDGIITHSQTIAGRMNWNSDIFIKVVGTPLNYRILENNTLSAGAADITLSDNEVAYLNMQRNITLAQPLVWTNGSTAVSAAAPWTDELMEGDFIRLAEEDDTAFYQIATIVDDSNVTLTQAFSGVSNTYESYASYGVYGTTNTVFTNPPVSPTANRYILTDAREDVPFTGDVWWLFARADDGGADALVYVRLNATQLHEGESTRISQGVSNDTLAFIGAIDDSDSTPIYSTKTPSATTAGNATVADDDNLTTAIKALDTESNIPLKPRGSNAGSFDQNLYFEDSTTVSGDGANKTVSPVASSVWNGLSGLSIDFSAPQPVGTPAPDFAIDTIVPVDTDFYVAGFSLQPDGLIAVSFSAGGSLVSQNTPSVIGALFPSSNLPIGYALLQYLTATGWRTAGSATPIIENSGIYRFNSGGGAGGSSGASYNDDLVSLLFQGKITDDLSESPLNALSTIEPTQTTATYQGGTQIYQINYDASKTVTGTGVNMVLSSSSAVFPAVDGSDLVGQMLIVGSEARKIVSAASNTTFVVEAGFTVDPAADACCVSEVVETKELYTYAGDGDSLSNAFLGSAYEDYLIDYEDSSAVGDNIFDVASAPVVGWSASGDGSTWSEVGERPTFQFSTAQSSAFPAPATQTNIRFFSTETSGAGSVNLLNYRFYTLRDTSVTTAGNFVVDTFSGDGVTTVFNLTQAPGSINNTFVYITGVYQQKPSYTVVGTVLTFSAAPPAGTDNIQVVSGFTLPFGIPSDGSVTVAKLDSGAAVSGSVLTADGSGGASYVAPMVSQYSAGGAQVIADNTYTKVAFPTVVFDPNSIWSTVNNRFTATIAGYYRVGAVVGFVGGGGSWNGSLFVYKNGSPYKTLAQFTPAQMDALGGNCLVQLNVGEYVEFFVRQQSGVNQTVETTSYADIERVIG